MKRPDIPRRYPLTFAASACLAASLCFMALPGQTLDVVLFQTGAAAVCVVLLLAAFDRAAIRQRVPLQEQEGGVRPDTVCLLASALAVGLAALVPVVVSGERAGSTDVEGAAVLLRHGVLFLVLCLLTGVFEEALFRGVLFRRFAVSCAGTSRPALMAAAVSSAVFGLLHIPAMAAQDSFGAVMALCAAAKAGQAVLFGFVMAGIYTRSGSLLLAAGLHAAFNALSDMQVFVTGDSLVATYAAGSVAELALLLAGSIPLLFLAVRAARFFWAQDIPASLGPTGTCGSRPSP